VPFQSIFKKNNKRIMTKLAHSITLRTIVCFAALTAFGFFAGPVQAQKAYGVVDVNAVVTAMPEYIAANQKIEAQRKVYMDSITTMQTSYQAKVDAYSKVGESATPEFKKKSAADLDELQQVFNKFREDKFGQEGELAKLQAQLMKPITDKIQNMLESFRKKEKVSLILPRTAVIALDPELDLTAKFQAYMTAQDAK
jgi:outer membrane protein